MWHPMGGMVPARRPGTIAVDIIRSPVGFTLLIQAVRADSALAGLREILSLELSTKASGFGLCRFDKAARTIDMHCYKFLTPGLKVQ